MLIPRHKVFCVGTMLHRQCVMVQSKNYHICVVFPACSSSAGSIEIKFETFSYRTESSSWLCTEWWECVDNPNMNIEYSTYGNCISCLNVCVCEFACMCKWCCFFHAKFNNIKLTLSSIAIEHTHNCLFIWKMWRIASF